MQALKKKHLQAHILKDKKTKRHKDKKTKRQKDKKTKRQKDKDKRQIDKDQKENMILRYQGRFALLRCF